MKNYVTKSGYQKLMEELNYLMTVENKKAIELISEAREKGDISENSEYDIAKEYHDNLSNKIQNLQEKIRNSEIISQSSLSSDVVNMLSKVEVKNQKSNKNQIFDLVPENEIDPKNGKISFNSPIGVALMGKKIGDVVEVNVPVGKVKFEILNIKNG